MLWGRQEKIENWCLLFGKLNENPSTPRIALPSESKMSLLRRRSPPAHEQQPLMEMAVVGTSKIELQMKDEAPPPTIKLYHTATWPWSGDIVAEYYEAFLPDGARARFTTKIKYIRRTVTQETEWKLVKVTAVHNWWGTSLKEERVPVQNKVTTTEQVYYEITPEMLAFHKSLGPVLEAKDSTKVLAESPTGMRKWTPDTVVVELLNTFEKDQSVVVRPIVVGTSGKWDISWKPLRLQKAA